MRRKFELTPELLREVLNYNPETGILTWNRRDRKFFKGYSHYIGWNKRFEGKEAFTSKNSEGYKTGTLLGNCVKAHRICWVLAYGEWPYNVDHINGDTSDNRLLNLRDVSRSINLKNQRMKNSNTSGRVGVYWHKKSQKWQAIVGSERKCFYLGLFDTKEDAIKAREKAEAKLDFHENHGRIM